MAMALRGLLALELAAAAGLPHGTTGSATSTVTSLWGQLHRGEGFSSSMNKKDLF